MIANLIKAMFPYLEVQKLEEELRESKALVRELDSLLRVERGKYAELKQSKAEDWAAACKSAQAASSAIMDLQRQVFCIRGGGRRAGS